MNDNNDLWRNKHLSKSVILLKKRKGNIFKLSRINWKRDKEEYTSHFSFISLGIRTVLPSFQLRRNYFGQDASSKLVSKPKTFVGGFNFHNSVMKTIDNTIRFASVRSRRQTPLVKFIFTKRVCTCLVLRIYWLGDNDSSK